MMSAHSKPTILSDIGPEYEPRFVNKKQASKDKRQARRLAEAGYVMPEHWAQKARPFIGWDGEGITYPGDSRQSYVLFGASTGDRISKPSLGTTECFDLLLSVERQQPNAIHVGFALQYDVNMMFKDLQRRHLERIYRSNKCNWEGYRIEYRPGKWLNIRKGDTTVRLYDVFGFFQSSFVTACEKFLGKNDPELEAIRVGKAARQSFSYDQLEPFIVPYWEGELRLLVRLMDSLREDLESADLRIGSWHGPGAVANTVFRKQNIKAAKAITPPEVNRAAQFAYAGGRFELFQAGIHNGTVYEYDINSAYPSAIAELPNLQTGYWEHVREFEAGSFGVWRIDYDDRDNPVTLFTKPQPLFYRDGYGNVSYPSIVQGWYWSPEAALVSRDSIKEGWVYRDDGSRPFEFVRTMYETRQEWKSQGNSAEKALKLALNSLYGKMAQRTGWIKGEAERIPVWHQLEWAGFVTSQTRAKIVDAISIGRQESTHFPIIAVETDAVFSTVPLSLTLGKALGEWEETRFDWIAYVQNGMYYAEKDGELVEKYRGFDKGSLPFEQVKSYMQQPQFFGNTRLEGVTTRFIGLGLGLHTKAVWGSWQTDTRQVVIGGGGKRKHEVGVCPACKAGLSFAQSLHPLVITTSGGRSEPHRLPWLTDSEPELRVLDELTAW